MKNRKNAPKQGIAQGPVIIQNLNEISAAAGGYGVSVGEIDQDDVTLATFIIDQSGSMGSVAKGVIDAYNRELDALEGSERSSGILVCTTTFASQTKLLHGYQKVAQTPRLSNRNYRPSGGTALYDAIEAGLTNLENYRQTLSCNGVRSDGLLVVLSDGGDNQSKLRLSQLRKRVEAARQEEALTLAYVGFGAHGAQKDLQRLARSMGFESVITANQTESEIRRILGQVSQRLIRGPSAVRGASGGLFAPLAADVPAYPAHTPLQQAPTAIGHKKTPHRLLRGVVQFALMPTAYLRPSLVGS